MSSKVAVNDRPSDDNDEEVSGIGIEVPMDHNEHFGSRVSIGLLGPG